MLFFIIYCYLFSFSCFCGKVSALRQNHFGSITGSLLQSHQLHQNFIKIEAENLETTTLWSLTLSSWDFLKAGQIVSKFSETIWFNYYFEPTTSTAVASSSGQVEFSQQSTLLLEIIFNFSTFGFFEGILLDKMTFCMTQSAKVVIEEVRSDYKRQGGGGDKSHIMMFSWASPLPLPSLSRWSPLGSWCRASKDNAGAWRGEAGREGRPAEEGHRHHHRLWVYNTSFLWWPLLTHGHRWIRELSSIKKVFLGHPSTSSQTQTS